MLRITRITTDDSQLRLKVEGKLLAPWLDELIAACEEIGREQGRVELDLSTVAFVDAAGVQVLQNLIRAGVSLSACSQFVQALLHQRNS